jgi:replication factor A1
MNISELKAKQGNIDVQGTIAEIGETRSFNKFGKAGRVATAIIKDDSGSVKLTLWNEQIELVKPGDVVQLKNGWADEFRGELQISTGRNGTMEVIGKKEETAQEAPETAEFPEEDVDVDEEEVEE